MELKVRAKITGTGSFAPEKRMTNKDLEAYLDTSDEWISSMTGIKERRIAADGIGCSDLAVEAGQRALEAAGCQPKEIDMVITGTVTPDYRLPSCACEVQAKMGLVNAVAFDVVAACAGFISGLSIASTFIETYRHKKILVIGAEKLSSITNYHDRATAILFGDGAGAAVVEASHNGSGIQASYMKSDGRLRDSLWIPSGGSMSPVKKNFDFDGSEFINMSGQDIFKTAVREMSGACVKVLDEAGVSADQLKWIIPHQANIRIIEAIAKRLKVGMDRVIVNIHKYGNTSAGSVPLALDETYRAGKISEGDYILLVAFGGGLIWGATLIKW